MSTNFQRLPLLAIPVLAAAAIPANTFVTGNGAVPVAAADALGIAQNAITIATMGAITCLGIETLLLGGTVAQDGLIEVGTAGAGNPLAAGKAKARALQAGVLGDLIPVVLLAN